MGMSIVFWHWEGCDGQGGLEEHFLLWGGVGKEEQNERKDRCIEINAYLGLILSNL